MNRTRTLLSESLKSLRTTVSIQIWTAAAPHISYPTGAKSIVRKAKEKYNNFFLFDAALGPSGLMFSSTVETGEETWQEYLKMNGTMTDLSDHGCV